MRIDFDDIWQKYSKCSRIEFARFSFHVGLHFETQYIFDIYALRCFVTVTFYFSL